MYKDKVSRGLCRSWITLMTLITLGLVATIALLEAQQPSNVPAVKATGAQSGVLREMAELKPDATFDVGGDPDWMAVSEDAVWVTISSKNEVRQLRASDNTLGFTIKVKEPCSGLVAAYGSLWIPSCGSRNLVRASLTTGKIQKTIPIAPADSEGGITAGAGAIWMTSNSAGRVARIDPRTNRAVATIAVPSGSFCPIFFAGYVWITSTEHSLLTKINPKTNRVIARIAVGKNPRFLTAGAGSIWTLNQGDGTVTRVQVKTGRRVADIPAGLAGKGGEIAFGFDSVWATLEQFPITRIDAASNDIASQWRGAGGDSIRAGHGTIWLTDLRGGKVWRISPGKL
jgi:virginiamycin B lyase